MSNQRSDILELAIKHASDKLEHGYMDCYRDVLECKRDTCKRVLEIGIGTPNSMAHVMGYKPGDSLRFWEEYFPNAEVIGLDIEYNVLFEAGRIKTYLCDQSDPHALGKIRSQLGWGFELIVDDGSHIPIHQLTSFFCLFPLLKNSGFYFIEDIHDNDLEMISGAIKPYAKVDSFRIVRHNREFRGLTNLIRIEK